MNNELTHDPNSKEPQTATAVHNKTIAILLPFPFSDSSSKSTALWGWRNGFSKSTTGPFSMSLHSSIAISINQEGGQKTKCKPKQGFAWEEKKILIFGNGQEMVVFVPLYIYMQEQH